MSNSDDIEELLRIAAQPGEVATVASPELLFIMENQLENGNTLIPYEFLEEWYMELYGENRIALAKLLNSKFKSKIKAGRKYYLLKPENKLLEQIQKRSELIAVRVYGKKERIKKKK